jgi:crotonobetainyl-CoA:carnitine CoA-transferase CaiB-like acyl-CoA transferase
VPESVRAAPTTGAERRLSEDPPDARRPLEGIRVADFTRVLAGPLCTMVLGDLGADVVKVERPGTGDDTRHWGPPFVGDDAAYFLSLNRNKRSIELDLSAERDRATASSLVRSSDVVVENFRPGLMTEFGLDWESVHSMNPGVVYCSLTAFGADGAARPGYDIIAQATSGLMSVTGERHGAPVKVGVALLDVITGLYAANGIQAGLRRRDVAGEGSHVTVSLFEASVAGLVNQGANYLLGGIVPRSMGTGHPNIVPYQVFAASDRPFVLAAGTDRHFERACEAIGRPELAVDPRFATNEARVRHREAVIGVLSEAFASRPSADVLPELERRGVPCSVVRTIEEVFASPEGAAMIQAVDDPARGTLRLIADPIRLAGELPSVRRPPPRLGQHTEELIAELAPRADRSGDHPPDH